MAHGVAVPLHNGLLSPNLSKLTSEIQQYDKVLKLRDEIIAGTHLSIKLTPSKPVQVTSQAASVAPAAKSNSTAPTTVSTKPQANGLPGLSAPVSSPYDGRNTVRSKIRLEQQRIERNLSESYRKENNGNGHKGYEQDVPPSFDVSEVYYQAQELVRHTREAPHTNAHASRTQSADEETFYSSGVGTEGSEESAQRKPTTRPCKFFFEDGICKKGDKCNFSHDPAFRHQMQKTGLSTTNRAPRPGYTAQGGRIRESPVYNVEDGEAADEPPYSPSMNIAVEDLPQQHSADQTSRVQPGHHHISRNNSRTDSRQQGRYSPRGRDTPIIRNHITSPVAPQPSRVSPLAVTKVSRVEKNRNDNGRHQLITVTPQSAPRSKKRRRDMDASENARNVAARTTMVSPEPYVKQEPISPPPLSASLPQLPRQSGLINGSPRHSDRHVYEIDDGYDRAPRGASNFPPTHHRRVLSGPGPTSGPRERRDLRRIVSTRNLERPSSPGLGSSARPRTPSQMIVPREEIEHLSYRPSFQPQRQSYMAADRPASPNVRYVSRVAEDPDLVPMSRPSGRIVVDEYGRRYLETVVEDRRGSVMPEPRYVDEIRRRPEVVESVRASVRPEPRYVDEIRRRPEALEPIRGSIRPEARYADDLRQVPVIERRYPEAMPTHTSYASEARYYDDQQYPTESVLRPRASVRPEPRSHDERQRPVESSVLSRASIRPEARAEAVFINPRFEQFNFSGPPGKPASNGHRDVSHVQREQSPSTRPRFVEYRESAQPAPRAIYNAEPTYSSRQDIAHPTDTERLIRSAERYARMAENASSRMSVRPEETIGRASVRPLEYVERASHQMGHPEIHRRQESFREPIGYSSPRQDLHRKQDLMEIPSPAGATYRYVSVARDIPQGSRAYDTDMYID